MSGMNREAILNDPDFKEMIRRKDRISLFLTVAELVLYFGFIALVAFNKPFLATKVSGVMTIGIPIAVGTIFLSWVLTGIYIFWANSRYDQMVKNIKAKIGG
jgi:uncharacterized membrane protein (DUF485 family)